jgi:hypothetical protein
VNAAKLFQALDAFGAPLNQISEEDFERPGVVFQIGIAPLRIDILTGIDGVGFDEAWKTRATFPIGPFEIPFIGKDVLIRNKRATGRPRHLLDAESLESS